MKPSMISRVLAIRSTRDWSDFLIGTCPEKLRIELDGHFYGTWPCSLDRHKPGTRHETWSRKPGWRVLAWVY